MTDTNGQKGFALLVVLLIIAVLTAMVGEFMFSTKLHAELMANHRDRVKARYLARSAINAYVYLAELNQIRPGQLLYGTSNWLGYGSGFDMLEGADLMSAMLLGDSPISPASEGPLKGQWSIPLPGGGFDLEGMVHGRIVNERGKININGLVKVINPGDKTRDIADPVVYGQLRTLMLLRGVDDEDVSVCVDSLVDWIDGNSGVEPYGAELDYYHSLDVSYFPRNDLLVSVAEMLLVQGCTMDLYDRIKDFVTVYPMIGPGKPDSCIDPNVAPKMVLMAVFLSVRPPGSDTPYNDPNTASEVADDIYRKAVEKASLTVTVSPEGEVSVSAGQPLNTGDISPIIKQRLEGSKNIIGQLSCRLNPADPRYYTATGAGEVNGIISVIEAVFVHENNAVKILHWKEE